MKGLRLGAAAPLMIFLLIVGVSAFVLFQGGARRDQSETGMIGALAPAYALPDLSGSGTIEPKAFAGRAYLINFYASWCGPCRLEHPYLLALKAQGVPILGVAYKDKGEAAAAFLRQLGDPYAAVGLDAEGRYALEIGAAGVPETFVIGPDGAIRALHRGPLDPTIIEAKILPALAAP